MKNLHLLLAAAAGAAALGCGQPRAPLSVIAGIDASDSTRPYLSAYVLSLSSVAMSLDDRSDAMTVLRFDRTCSEIYGPIPPASSEEFQAQMVHYLRAGAKRRGTLPEFFYEQAAQLAAHASTKTVILCYTDGDIDDQSRTAEAEMKEAAVELAANSKVCAVIVTGTLPGAREQIRLLMAPLGPKLEFREIDQVEDAL